jgi:hypothetical protein
MSPITHFLVGWLVANTSTALTARERALVALAGVIPDVDGVGLVAEVLTRDSDHPLLWFSDYHHLLGHNLGFCLVVTAAVAARSSHRWLAGALAAASFHAHLLGDLVGSRGPEGYQWPIPYLLPFSNHLELSWSGQWALNAWQNMLITAIALVLTFSLARSRGYSPVGIVSAKADRAFVDTLRRRFPLRSDA